MGAGLATVQTFLQPLTDAVTGFAAVSIPAITSAGAAITEYLGSPQVAAYIQTLSTFFGQLATTVQDILVLAFQGATIAWKLLSDAFTVMWPYIQTVFDTFLSLATIVINFVTGLLTTISQLVKGDFAGAWETAKKTIGTSLDAIWEFCKTLYANVTGFVTDMVNQFKTIGTNISEGIANGISESAGKIATAAKDAAKGAYNAALEFLGIASPSRLMRDMVGVNFSKGMAQGITAGIPDVVEAARLTAAAGAGTVNNYSFSATYANTQSESSLIADARSMMMTLGASA
jgi:phage-related protein